MQMQSEVLHKVAQVEWLYYVGGDYELHRRVYVNFSALILFVFLPGMLNLWKTST